MRNYTFNGISVQGEESSIKIQSVELNPDNPKTAESQTENASRLEGVFKSPMGYDASQPVILISLLNDKFRVIKGNGRIGGAQSLESSDPKRYTEVFGADGLIPAIVLSGLTEREIVIIMSDHDNVDARPQSAYESFLSVKLLVDHAYKTDSKSTRETIGKHHGQSGSWSQSFVYMVELFHLDSELFDTFRIRALDKAESSKFRYRLIKDLRTIWNECSIDSDEFRLAWRNCHLYATVKTPTTESIALAKVQEGKSAQAEIDVKTGGLIVEFIRSLELKNSVVSGVVDAVLRMDKDWLAKCDDFCGQSAEDTLTGAVIDDKPKAKLKAKLKAKPKAKSKTDVKTDVKS